MRRTSATLAAALGIAAVLTVGLVGSAAALEPFGTAIGSAEAAPSDPPTAGLRRLAEAMIVTNRGLSAQVSLPAGLTTTPTEVSVSFGANRETHVYNNANGTGADVSVPPQNGAVRTEYLSVSMRELTPENAHYSTVRQLTVVPKFRVDISVLGVTAPYEGRCDYFGGADPTVVWLEGDGERHRQNPSYGVIDGSYVASDSFGGTYYSVSMNDDIRLFTLSWYDRDFGEIGDYALTRREERLLPLPENLAPQDAAGFVAPYERVITEVLPDSGGDRCTAQLSYRLTYTLLNT